MNLKKYAPYAVSLSLLSAGLAAPTVASAEVSASLSLANMYLWRGQNLTPDGPQISGSLDYAHDSGLYAGIWATNETGGHETDLYVGFAGEAGGFSYDVSYWYYLYPEDGTAPNDGLGDTSLSDIVLSGGMADFTVTFYIAEETQGGPDAIYYTLDYTIGDVNLLYGGWDVDAPGGEYSHVQVSYSYSENLTFAVSVASDDTAGVEEDPLFLVSYSVPLSK
jgi:uncharacterized protein (TIGR02001 family)